MNEEIINWDQIPDIINKDQLYRICHISKSTALYLLRSGKIPCTYTVKKTRCYNIKKEDVLAYLKERKVFPEAYSAPVGWYHGKYELKMEAEVPPEVLNKLRAFYTKILTDYPDVVTVQDVIKLTGYKKTAINNWCNNGKLQSFKRKNSNLIPKVYLIQFFCSEHFRMITRKTDWHIRVMRDFSVWNGK